jgi:hypothetical protein
VLSRGKQTPNPDGQRSTSVNVHSRATLDLLTSRVPNSDIARARHLDSTTSPGPHSATSASGLRGSRNTRLQVFCCWSPRLPNPRHSGFVPPVPPGIDGPDQIEESPFAISTCMGFLHSPTPIRRYAMAKGSFCCLRVNSLSSSSRSNDPLDFARLHDDSVRRFSSSMKRSPLRHLPPVRLQLG